MLATGAAMLAAWLAAVRWAEGSPPHAPRRAAVLAVTLGLGFYLVGAFALDAIPFLRQGAAAIGGFG